MALPTLAQNIVRFHELSATSKEIEAERDALKIFFRKEAGTVDAVFKHKDIEVPVTWKERSSWDSDTLNQRLGKDAAACKKVSRYAEVSCRMKEKT